MCVVSMIGDHFHDKWWERPYIQNPIVNPINNRPIVAISKDEFDQLKKEVEEMKALLKRAKLYDEKNNEPDCEIQEKMDFLRKVAALVGVDLDEVFKK